MPLDSHQIVLQSLGWIQLTVELACFCAEPAEPLRGQSVIVCQQNVRRHFVAWKAQACPQSHTLFCVSRGLLGHKATTRVLKIIVFEITVELLAGQ